MSGFYVTFWGSRGTIPTPGWQTQRHGGNTSCIEVRANNTMFICDAGTGVRELGVDLLRRSPEPIVAHFLFSHPHWDHIQGFPFFTPAYMPRNTFLIYGTEEGDDRFFEMLNGQMVSDYFPVQFADLGATIKRAYLGKEGADVEGVRIKWFRQVHPGTSLAYSFEFGGYKVVYATDHELDLSIRNKDAANKDPSLHRDVAERYIDFIRGAELLIADGQYLDEEYLDRVGWGHPRATTVVDAAIDAGVKRLAIHHHDPMHSDRDVDWKVQVCRERAVAQKASIQIFAAREQVELRVDDPKGHISV